MATAAFERHDRMGKPTPKTLTGRGNRIVQPFRRKNSWTTLMDVFKLKWIDARYSSAKYHLMFCVYSQTAIILNLLS
jgi:hypothetical protein